MVVRGVLKVLLISPSTPLGRDKVTDMLREVLGEGIQRTRAVRFQRFPSTLLNRLAEFMDGGI